VSRAKSRRVRKAQDQVEKPPQSPVNPATSGTRNAAQREAIRVFSERDILFLIGPAGSGKTHAAVALAYSALLAGVIENVIVTRPVVECDNEKLGHLPGDIAEKFHPWLMPFQDVLRTIIGKGAGKVLASFETCPLAYVRGRTFSHCVAILDEAQNASMNQLKAYLTRIGEGAKMVICADPDQSDRVGCGQRILDLAVQLDKAGVASLVRFTPDMIVRSPHIAKILKVFEALDSRPS
jgi:phosphate starvation-inducible protein PhoH and related proteins